MNEDRFEKIETKIIHQEDLVEELNKVVHQQQKKLDQLEMICAALLNRVESLAEAVSDKAPANEKPPHY